jgi:hypothetical protein
MAHPINIDNGGLLTEVCAEILTTPLDLSQSDAALVEAVKEPNDDR